MKSQDESIVEELGLKIKELESVSVRQQTDLLLVTRKSQENNDQTELFGNLASLKR